MRPLAAARIRTACGTHNTPPPPCSPCLVHTLRHVASLEMEGSVGSREGPQSCPHPFCPDLNESSDGTAALWWAGDDTGTGSFNVLQGKGPDRGGGGMASHRSVPAWHGSPIRALRCQGRPDWDTSGPHRSRGAQETPSLCPSVGASVWIGVGQGGP